MYAVEVERSAERDLRRLASTVQPQVIAAIKGLAGVPRPSGCRKLSGSKTDWRIRVGDYRIVYEIADTLRVVRITRVRHRRDVYR